MAEAQDFHHRVREEAAIANEREMKREREAISSAPIALSVVVKSALQFLISQDLLIAPAYADKQDEE
ncbi:MAG: hypothetical protein Q9190_001098, partial [Brigantiaea leucoxantha]